MQQDKIGSHSHQDSKEQVPGCTVVYFDEDKVYIHR